MLSWSNAKALQTIGLACQSNEVQRRWRGKKCKQRVNGKRGLPSSKVQQQRPKEGRLSKDRLQLPAPITKIAFQNGRFDFWSNELCWIKKTRIETKHESIFISFLLLVCDSGTQTWVYWWPKEPIGNVGFWKIVDSFTWNSNCLKNVTYSLKISCPFLILAD